MPGGDDRRDAHPLPEAREERPTSKLRSDEITGLVNMAEVVVETRPASAALELQQGDRKTQKMRAKKLQMLREAGEAPPPIANGVTARARPQTLDDPATTMQLLDEMRSSADTDDLAIPHERPAMPTPQGEPRVTASPVMPGAGTPASALKRSTAWAVSWKVSKFAERALTDAMSPLPKSWASEWSAAEFEVRAKTDAIVPLDAPEASTDGTATNDAEGDLSNLDAELAKQTEAMPPLEHPETAEHPGSLEVIAASAKVDALTAPRDPATSRAGRRLRYAEIAPITKPPSFRDPSPAPAVSARDALATEKVDPLPLRNSLSTERVAPLPAAAVVDNTGARRSGRLFAIALGIIALAAIATVAFLL